MNLRLRDATGSSSGRVLMGLCVVALAWRVAQLVHYRMIDTDSAYYGAMARLFAEGHWSKALDPIWPPFYPFLTSLAVRAGLSLEAAGITVSLLASTGCVLTCTLLGRLVFGDRVGTLAGLLALIHPRLVFVSQEFLTEALYAFLTSGALVAYLRALNATRRITTGSGLLIAGLLLALAFLTRPEAIIFLVVLMMWSAVQTKSMPARKTGARVVAAATLLIAFTLVVLPYLVNVSHIEGRWILAEKGSLNFYLTYRQAYEEEGILVEKSDYGAITGVEQRRQPGNYRVLEFVRRRPDLVVMKTLRNLPEALFSKIPSLVYVPFMLLAVFGLLHRRTVRRSRTELLFGVWIVGAALLVSPLFLFRRFFIAALPLLIVWAAVGLEELRHRIPRPAFSLALVAWIAFFAIYTHRTLAKRQPPILYKQAGLWLQEHGAGEMVLTGRKPETSFYAVAQFQPLEPQTVDGVAEFVSRQNVTHLIVDDYVFTRSHPQLAFLLDAAQAPSWLEPVYSATAEKHHVIVYAVRDRDVSHMPSRILIDDDEDLR